MAFLKVLIIRNHLEKAVSLIIYLSYDSENQRCHHCQQSEDWVMNLSNLVYLLHGWLNDDLENLEKAWRFDLCSNFQFGCRLTYEHWTRTYGELWCFLLITSAQASTKTNVTSRGFQPKSKQIWYVQVQVDIQEVDVNVYHLSHFT